MMGICHRRAGCVRCAWLVMRNLLAQSLFNEGTNASIEWLCLGMNTLAELCWSQVEVQTSRFGALMSGKERDVIQVHACSFQDGTALVTQRMRRQCGKPHFFPHPFSDAHQKRQRRAGGLGYAWTPTKKSFQDPRPHRQQ